MNGFVRSILLANSDTPLDLSPVAKAEFQYNSELTEAYGFNSTTGLYEVVATCKKSHEAMLVIDSQYPSWQFIQAALGFISSEDTTPYLISDTLVGQGPLASGNTSFTLPNAPLAGASTPVRAVNVDTGAEIVVVSTTGTTVVLTGDQIGKRVNVSYYLGTATPTIRTGSSVQIDNVAVSGVFRSCKEGRTYLLTMGNATISAEFKLTASEGVETSSLTLKASPDKNGDLFVLKQQL